MSKFKHFFHSVRVKIAFVLFFIILLFLISLIFIIRTTIIENIQTNTVENIYNQQMQMDEGLTLVLDSISLPYTQVVEKPQFGNLLLNDLTIEERQTQFQEMISNLVVNKNIFTSIVLYYSNAYYYSNLSNENLNISLEFGEKVTSSTKLIEEGPVVFIGDEPTLIFGKPLRGYDGGCLLFGISEEVLKETINIDSELGYSFLVDHQDFILSHPNSNYVGNIIFENNTLNFSNLPNFKIQDFEGNKSIVIMNEASKIKDRYNLGWTIVSVLSYDYLFQGIDRLNLYTTLIAIATTIVALVLAITLSAGLVGPINRLKNKVKSYSFDKTNQTVISSGDEIQELEISFNEMMKRISDLIEENAEEAENKRKLELFALQIQINPHFLYNTLDAIAWLAKLKKQPEIEHLVIALARFFRISLHKGDKFITVKEEIEIIKNFIVIELIRFPNKFSVEYNVSDEVKELITMKLILQPIVENAIKHGISGMDQSGHIIVNAYCDGEYIYYEIIDDGLGFDPNQEMQKKLASSGYGLKNVDERIKLEYGDDCGVTVDSKLNGGTKVSIKIKKRN